MPSRLTRLVRSAADLTSDIGSVNVILMAPLAPEESRPNLE